MGKKIFIIVLLFSTISLSAQKKEVKELKKYALCSCVNKNYARIDSSFYSSDVSNSYIFQYSSLSANQLERFDKFIEEKTQNIFKETPYGSFDVPKANMIFYFCMKFYESRELDKFLKKK